MKAEEAHNHRPNSRRSDIGPFPDLHQTLPIIPQLLALKSEQLSRGA